MILGQTLTISVIVHMTLLSILRLAPNPSPSVLNEDSLSLRFLDRKGFDFILGLILLKYYFCKLFYPGSILEGRKEILKIFGWHLGRNDDLINSF